MGYKKWRPSKAQRESFASAMCEIDSFCESHGIRQSFGSDSYYFEVGGIAYRVSNHTVEASNRGAYAEDRHGNRVKTRELYHPDGESGLVCITASKTRLIEIYNDLVAGYELTRRGYRKNA